MEKLQDVLNRMKKLFGNRLFAVFCVVLVAASGFGGWQIVKNAQKQPQYQTAKVERGTIVSSVSVSGQIISTNIVTITTQASGVVQDVFVKDGDTVVAGQNVLEVTLDSSGQQKNASAWSSYLSAKNAIESAKASQFSLQSDMFSKWRTFTDLAESSSYDTPEERDLPQFQIAEKDWLAAESKYKNQAASIAQAQAALTSAWFSYQETSPIVTAPIAGTVSSISVVEGMTVGGQTSSTTDTTQSQKVAVIQNQTNPLGTFSLSEIDASKVTVGQKATITIDSLTGKTFTGKVASVDRIGSVTSGVTSYPVIIRFDSTVPEILPNMAASANIMIDAKDNVLLVPSGAIQVSQEQSVVRVLKNGKELQVTVETGLTSDTQTEIISGLSENDDVITSTVTTGSAQQSSGSLFGGFGTRGVGGGTLFRSAAGGGGQR